MTQVPESSSNALGLTLYIRAVGLERQRETHTTQSDKQYIKSGKTKHITPKKACVLGPGTHTPIPTHTGQWRKIPSPLATTDGSRGGGPCAVARRRREGVDVWTRRRREWETVGGAADVTGSHDDSTLTLPGKAQSRSPS